jgi:hypothetical protein
MSVQAVDLGQVARSTALAEATLQSESEAVSPVIANEELSEEAPVEALLAAGTPVVVMLDAGISTSSHVTGDPFGVTVLEDVVENGTVVIPRGSAGTGQVTFVTKRGAFGKPGIIALRLDRLIVGDREFGLDGRYREEGANNNGATFATWLAVGVFSGFIKGKSGEIEQGRELKARTGEAIPYRVGQDAAAIETTIESSPESDVGGDLANEPVDSGSTKLEG